MDRRMEVGCQIICDNCKEKLVWVMSSKRGSKDEKMRSRLKKQGWKFHPSSHHRSGFLTYCPRCGRKCKAPVRAPEEKMESISQYLKTI